jgi:hypothetical protein
MGNCEDRVVEDRTPELGEAIEAVSFRVLDVDVEDVDPGGIAGRHAD